MPLVAQAVDTQVVDTLVAALVAIAGQQSVRSAGHPYIAALRISLPHDDLLHRLLHLLQLPSRVVFFF